MMLISAMIASNLPMTTVFAAAKKQQVKQETKKLEEQSRKMQQEIKDLDEKMIKSNDAYEACQEKLISVQKQLKKTQQELKEAKASKEDQSRIMSKRIKFLYENGNMAYMEVIFEANNFQEFLKRADYVSKISKYDSNMFLQLQTTEDKIRMATKSLKQDYQNTKTLTAKAKTEKEKLDQAAAKKKSKLASYQKQLASDKELLAWYEAEEKRQEEMELASERKRQSVLRMELEWAKRGCRARSTKQRARLERLEALKNGKAPVQEQALELDSVETRMGKKTVELHHISKRYGEKNLVEDFDYIVLRNQRLAFVGPNGCGKSTILKMIAGLVEPDSGQIEVGETVKIGYFAQEVPDMNTNQRVIDYIKDIAEYVPTRDGRITASQMLERFLFTPDMQYAPVSKLSGGEQKRLYLLSVLISAPNCLILDEISNDMDIPTLTILEDYLNSFSGIVITVSHDRYFLDNVVDRIFELDGCGHLQQYEGGYTDYVEAKLERMGSSVDGLLKSEKKEKKETAQKNWKQNRPQKLKFSYKEQREIETIDDDIAELEEKIEFLDAEMVKNATNSMKLSELMKEKEEAEQELEEKMDRWVYLNDLAEKIEAQK